MFCAAFWNLYIHQAALHTLHHPPHLLHRISRPNSMPGNKSTGTMHAAGTPSKAKGKGFSEDHASADHQASPTVGHEDNAAENSAAEKKNVKEAKLPGSSPAPVCKPIPTSPTGSGNAHAARNAKISFDAGYDPEEDHGEDSDAENGRMFKIEDLGADDETVWTQGLQAEEVRNGGRGTLREEEFAEREWEREQAEKQREMIEAMQEAERQLRRSARGAGGKVGGLMMARVE